MLPKGTQVNLVDGLTAPGKQRPSCVLTVVPSPYRVSPIFIRGGGPRTMTI